MIAKDYGEKQRNKLNNLEVRRSKLKDSSTADQFCYFLNLTAIEIIMDKSWKNLVRRVHILLFVKFLERGTKVHTIRCVVFRLP